VVATHRGRLTFCREEEIVKEKVNVQRIFLETRKVLTRKIIDIINMRNYFYQNALQEVIQGLKDNCHIFDPAQIYALADQLAALAPGEEFQAIKAQLYTAAAMFDDQAIAPIVKQLEEFKCLSIQF
jgi:hypothetical protein